MKTVKLNAFDNPFVYGVDNKEYLVFNIDNETQTLKFQSLIGDLKVKTANILFKANSLPAKLYEMVVDDDILTFTLPSVLTGYNGSMYVYLLLNYSDDLSTSDLYTFKLVDKGSSTFNFEISSICESNISTIVSEEIKNEGIAKSILDTVSNYEFDKLQHAQQSLSLVENAFSSTLEKRIDLFNSAYDKANATNSNTTGDINDSDIDIPSSNTDSDLKDYVENVKTQMSERLKDVTVVSQQIQDEMTQEKQSFLGSSLIFQQDLKQERDIISAYGESTRQHMDQEFNEVKDHADKVFSDFSEKIPDLDASIKQVNDKIVATDNKVGTLNTKVTNVENDVTELEKMHNEVTQTINNGKLISLYSNSLDFGDYDYSGRANLFLNLDFSKLSKNASAITEPHAYVKDGGSHFVLDFSDPSVSGVDRTVYIPAVGRLEKGATYIATVPMMISNDFAPEYGNTVIYPYCVSANNAVNRITYLMPDNSCMGKWGFIKKTFTVPTNVSDGEFTFFQIYSNKAQTGKLYIGYDIKIEKVTSTSDTATPYQPNLLDAPYYLSKVPLGENLADPKVKFPITSSVETLYSGRAPKDFVEGETYTVTIGATKHSTQSFGVYLALKNQAIFKPVEGLPNTWTATLKIDILGEKKNAVYIYQFPSASVGACQIDWIKIEKGDTRTPNIESYKYKGVSLRNTIDPTAFDWQEQIVADVSKLKEQVNTLTPKVDNSQLFKLTKDDGNTIKVDYMSPKPTSFLALAKNTGFYSISTAEARLMSDYNELPSLLQNTFLFINNYPPRDGFIIQEITGEEISTQSVHKYYRRIEPDGTYKNWNKVITDKDVSKMKKMYSNSIDFGDYDYSTAPNLLPTLDYSKLSRSTSVLARPASYIKDYGDYFVLDANDASAVGRDRNCFVPLVTRLTKGKTYTISVSMMFDDEFADNLGYTSSHLSYTIYTNNPATSDRPVVIYPSADMRNQWKRISKVFTVPADQKDGDYVYLQLYQTKGSKGKLYIRYDMMIQEGDQTSSQATAWKPNLLDAPYYLSKVPLGENIADPKKVFPIKTSAYNIYLGKNTEKYQLNQTYTLTMKATKPATQDFSVCLLAGELNIGNMSPVEGLTDVWQLTFTVSQAHIDRGVTDVLDIYQLPNTSVGAVQIDWLKIEKGNIRTPNISQFKYFGEGLKNSNNPNDYSWDITPEYTEKRVNNSVSLTEPQSIDGTKNFLETPLVKGKEVLYGDRLFEGFYGSGTVHSNFKTKTRLGVGGLVMDDQPRLPEPFEWNSGRWQATVIRDVTFYCEGTMYIDTGANMGKYIYIANWKDEAQTQYASGNPAGMGIAADNGYWYRNLKNFSWIVTLKKGDKFSIGIELAADKEVWNIQIRTLHIKELIPPLE